MKPFIKAVPLVINALLFLQLSTKGRGEGTDLGGGIVTRSDVEAYADLTLDVRDIQQSITGGNNGNALEIYLNGRNAERAAGSLFSLSDLGTQMSNKPIEHATPPYLFQLYGVSGRSINLDDLASNAGYANSYVQSAIQNGKWTAAMAALVLNIWMHAADKLYDAIHTCQTKTEADNPSQFVTDGSALDEFIALWIGSGQTHGSSEGFGLYSLTERADQFFKNDDEDSITNRELAEAKVNQVVKLLYQEGAALFSMPKVCTKDSPDSSRRFWSVVTRIYSQMHIPLMQMLIVSLLDEDPSAVNLYATAIIPQAAQCRPSVYDRLSEELLEGQPNFQRKKIILQDLQEIYSCFGITCSDIGTVAKEYDVEFPACRAPLDNAPMALYRPSSDVQPIARIDLDILQMRILTSLGSFKYAKIWYLYGRNSPRQRDSEYDPYDFYSLSDFASSTSRRNAEPYYSAFISYHNDPNYADVLIRNTLEGTGKWGANASIEQRSAIIAEASSFHVVYLHLIAQINDAVNHCKDLDQDGEYDLTHPWDEVAALTVGSLEGMNEGGSSNPLDGQMVWGLASRCGYQFQTLNSQGYAKVNSDLEDLLYAGKGEIDAFQCDFLEETAEQIKVKTLIPLFQSVLKYAISSEGLSPDSTSSHLALGEVFALSVIPIVGLYDPPSARILEENMIVHSGIKPVRGGAQQVADALGSSSYAMGLSPRELGSTSEANPSLLYGGSASPSIRPPILLSTLLSIVAAAFALT